MAATDIGNGEVLERLAALSDDASRIQFLTHHSGLLTSAFVAQLVEAVRTLVKADLKKACALADTAVAVANRLGDKESRAFALRAKGNTLWSLGQNKRASDGQTQPWRFARP